jgi:hypothetical protein
MMNNGKLVWHYGIGRWYTTAHDDEQRRYVIFKDYYSGWNLVIYSEHDEQEQGWHNFLKDAKREADSHHHAHIYESDNDNLKDYIQKYPLKDAV